MTANKKEIVKSIIKDFVTHMDTKRLQGIPLTKDEQFWISQKNGLSQYIYHQQATPIYEPEQKESKAKLDDPGEELLYISQGTIYNAITEMERGGIIEIQNGHFQMTQSDGEPYASHPILKIAPHLSITHIPVDDLVIFRAPERYADEIAHYLNSQFFCNDIYTVAVSGLIICLDVSLPEKSKYEAKHSTVEKRVKQALKYFNLEKYTDKSIEPGYTPQQVEKRRLDEREAHLRSQVHTETEISNSYGGIIKKRPVRKIKCKPVDPKPH